MENELTQEGRASYVSEKIEFYLDEIYRFCDTQNLSRTGTHYWHIVSNRVSCMQGRLAKFRKEGGLEKLSDAEQHIKELEIYFRLLENFPDYLKGEFQPKGARGNMAFPEMANLSDADYIHKSKQRLESENDKE